jgi:hypothetical protein
VTLLAGLAVACGSSTPLLEESLDYGTGVTLTRSTAPVVLYRDNSGHAAYARDFVYVGPIEVNRMGSYNYYLWLGIWSTLDDSSRWTKRDGFESITLYADGEPLQLEVAGWSVESIGASRPVFTKPVASAARPRTSDVLAPDDAIPPVAGRGRGRDGDAAVRHARPPLSTTQNVITAPTLIVRSAPHNRSPTGMSTLFTRFTPAR